MLTNHLLSVELLKTHDNLVEMGFDPSMEQLPRWCAIGFCNGIRLAFQNEEYEPSFNLILKKRHHGLLEQSCKELDAVMSSAEIPKDHEIDSLRSAFRLWLGSPLKDQRRVELLAESELHAFYFSLSVSMGAHAQCLKFPWVKELNEIYTKSSSCQRFLSDQILLAHNAPEKTETPLLIEYFKYCYPTGLEREIIVSQAATFCDEGQTDFICWLLAGFGHGRKWFLSKQEKCMELFGITGEEGMTSIMDLYENFMGGSNGDLCPASEQILASLTWCKRCHPHLFLYQDIPHQYELVRTLYDFSFWMGMLGEMKRKSQGFRRRF